MIEWFCRNHVAANLLLFSIVAAGLFSLFTRIPLEIFPSFESDIVEVNIALRGATPEDAELSIASRVEEAIADLEGIEEIRSVSREGGASIFAEVNSGYKPRVLLDEIKNRVDAINTLPTDAERPIVSVRIRKRDVITVTVSGDVTEREIREQIERVRDDLLQRPNVTHADITGVRNYEVAIEVPKDTLQKYGLTISDITRAIRQNSQDISSGNIRTDGGDILIRSKNQAYTKDQFEKVVLRTHIDGTVLTLGDLAKISDDFEETAVRTRFNGKLAAAIRVFRVGEQSAIEVAQDVREYIESQQAGLPEGIELGYWDDDSVIVKSRINTLVNNAVQGGLLVLLLLGLFLRPAVAFWVFIGIPASFLGAFLVMPFLGVTLNLISLFAFIVVLGIVVDDAIVTGENIYTHLNRQKNSDDPEMGIKAAIAGTQEVATPVTFGVLTTVAAFVPLFFMGGVRGPIFAQIPAIVIPVLLFSLIESKFVLPAHLKKIKPVNPNSKNKIARLQQKISSGFESAILKYYKPTLYFCLNNKLFTLSAFVGLLSVIIIAVSLGHTRFVFFGRIPSETVRMNLTMPTGTPFEITDRYAQIITNHAKAIKTKYTNDQGESVVVNIFSTTGGPGGTSNVASVRFEITSPEVRPIDITSRELEREWRSMIGSIPGAEALSFRSEIGRAGDPIDVQLRSDSFEDLVAAATIIKEHLGTYPEVYDVNDSFAPGKEELNIKLKPDAFLLGVTRQQVATQIRQAFFGDQAQRIQRGRDDVRVMVRLPREERGSIANLRNLLITTPTGQQVPVDQLAVLLPSRGPSAINRVDGYRTLNVRADVDKKAVNMTVLQADLQEKVREVVAGFIGMSFKMEGESEEQKESFTSLFWGSLGALFIIYTLLAIPLKSYLKPLMVMSVIPFGFIGAMLGHWLMGMVLTIMSMLGMLALTGIIVNDSLVLVDYINKMRAKGMNTREAVLTAGAARFRPVMLTSLTTFIGLMPLLFEKATQAQFLIPMAVSLGFGIIFATLITLVLIPINYLLLEQIKASIGAWVGAVRSYFSKA